MSDDETPAGWYDDGHGAQRWWDGTQWTEHTQGAGAPAGESAPAASDPEATRFASPADPGASGAPGVPPGPQSGPAYPQPGQPAYGAQPPYGNQPPYGAQPAYGTPAYGAGAAPGWNQPGSSGGSRNRTGLLVGLGAAAVVVVIGLVLLLTVVLGGDGPESVAEDFLAAQAEGDVEATCELSARAAQRATLETAGVDDCGELGERADDDEHLQAARDVFDDVDIETELDDPEETDDRATVGFTQEVTYTGDDQAAFDQYVGASRFTGDVVLVREDGDWRVEATRATG